MLPHEALERSRLLEQLAACAARLRRLLHRLAALRLQLVERKNQLAERVEQRQAHQQEAQQDEFEEGTGVIHGAAAIICGNYDTPPVSPHAEGAKFTRDARDSGFSRRATRGAGCGGRREPRHRRRQPAAVATARRPQALSRVDSRSRGDHGPQDVGVAAAGVAGAAEHRRDAAARLCRRRRRVRAFVCRRTRPRPFARARVLHRWRRDLSRRPALCDDASPDGNRARLRRRRALSSVRAHCLARDRARRSPARRTGRICLRLRHLRARNGAG